MFSKIEIEFLLLYLRGELEDVNRAIVDLERKARNAHHRAGRPGKRTFSREGARRDWTHHHYAPVRI